MKNLDLSAVTAAIRFPIKEGTLEFLQLANKELFDVFARGYITFDNYDPTKVYCLYGAHAVSAGIGFTQYTDAVFFYNGELFLAPQHISPWTTGTDVWVCNIITTQYTTNADPVIFSDGVPRNVHNIRQVKIQAGPSGSGTVSNNAASDLTAIVRPDAWQDLGDFGMVDLTNGHTLDGTGGKTIYNRYSLKGKNAIWQVQVRGGIVSGTMTANNAGCAAPDIFANVGMTFPFIFNSGSGLTTGFMGTAASTLGTIFLRQNLAAGTYDLDFTLIYEKLPSY